MDLRERNSGLNKITTVVLAMAGIWSGYNFASLNTFGKPILSGYYGLPENERIQIESSLNGMYGLAAMFGTLSMGELITRVGRTKLSMIFDCMAVLVYAIYWIDGIGMLYVVRLLSGYLSGNFIPLAGLILVELMPKHLAGTGNLLISTTCGVFYLIIFGI